LADVLDAVSRLVKMFPDRRKKKLGHLELPSTARPTLWP
jgi:hypothetical protein